MLGDQDFLDLKMMHCRNSNSLCEFFMKDKSYPVNFPNQNKQSSRPCEPAHTRVYVPVYVCGGGRGVCVFVEDFIFHHKKINHAS